MAAKKTPISKSDFIRNQPAALSAAEVVAKARAAGMTIRPGLVYEVRRTTKAKKVTAKKTAAPAKPATTTKADFVRARAHLSPQEIVEDAKAAGIKFDVGYVYNVRGYDKAAGRRSGAARAPARQAPAVHRPIATASSAETLLKAVAAEVGLGRAIELLQGERARVHSILRG